MQVIIIQFFTAAILEFYVATAGTRAVSSCNYYIWVNPAFNRLCDRETLKPRKSHFKKFL